MLSFFCDDLKENKTFWQPVKWRNRGIICDVDITDLKKHTNNLMILILSGSLYFFHPLFFISVPLPLVQTSRKEVGLLRLS